MYIGKIDCRAVFKLNYWTVVQEFDPCMFKDLNGDSSTRA